MEERIRKAIHKWARDNMRVLGKVSIRDLNLLAAEIAAELAKPEEDN